jgi:hypothetical protein
MVEFNLDIKPVWFLILLSLMDGIKSGRVRGEKNLLRSESVRMALNVRKCPEGMSSKSRIPFTLEVGVRGEVVVVVVVVTI